MTMASTGTQFGTASSTGVEATASAVIGGGNSGGSSDQTPATGAGTGVGLTGELVP
jgi:hypothetical protein